MSTQEPEPESTEKHSPFDVYSSMIKRSTTSATPVTKAKAWPAYMIPDARMTSSHADATINEDGTLDIEEKIRGESHVMYSPFAIADSVDISCSVCEGPISVRVVERYNASETQVHPTIVVVVEDKQCDCPRVIMISGNNEIWRCAWTLRK